MEVKDIMTTDVITVSAIDSVQDTLDKMKKFNVNGTPVVDEKDCLIGMLVKADIFRFLVDPGHIGESPVDWVMSKEIVSSNEDETIEQVAKILREKKITSIPIVKDKKLVGIVSFEDIVDYFLDKRM